MKPEQESLLLQARESLEASELLYKAGYFGFAASRAYYAMFYVAQAFLLQKDLSFSKHSGVLSAFGKHFAKTGIVPLEFHRYLIEGMEIRHAGDYASPKTISQDQSEEQIRRVKQFLDLAGQILVR